MKLTVTTFVSVDGVMQAPGGPEEDQSGGFERGGWLAPSFDEQAGQFMSDTFDKVGAFLLGRHTYDIFAGYWPKITDPNDPIAGKLNNTPKYVASTTLTAPSWEGTTVISGDVLTKVARLKQQPGGELQVHGSGKLVQTLHENDLVDEYRLLVFPVIIGGNGRRLFAADALATSLNLVESDITGSGIAIHVYQPTGRPQYATVGE